MATTASAYIPTSGSTVTRSADSTTIAAANMPWPTPQVIGPELVTNGTFDTDSTGWEVTIDNGWDFSGGSASHTGATGGRIRGAFSAEIGKPYSLRFDLDATADLSLSNTSVGIRNSGDSNFVNNAFLLSAGLVAGSVNSYEIVFVANDTTQYVAFYSEDNVSLDNISVREINPLALSFQMEGLVTYADNDVTTLDFYDWAADSSNYIDARLVTVASRTGQVQFRQEESNILDFVESSTTTYSPGINVPFNIASRHGSTFINGAVDGTALTADTTPTALPDLSATTFDLAPTFNGFIKEFRVWADDIGDTGIAEAST